MNTPRSESDQHRPATIAPFLLSECRDELPRAPLRAGYGRCSVSGCTCPAYMGQAELCGNCGHNYSLHW
ncbi:MAG TPA: hypothetical protein VGR80_12135 [Steroidobacteraceae bacterium]|nr:hypothetical protein [Steroidobacteraceae bacterium]